MLGVERNEAPSTNQLIRRWRAGDEAARDQLIERLLPDLQMIASAQLRQERNASFSSADLVNDAVLRLVKLGRIELQERAHIVALAARLMRNILVESARRRRAGKRLLPPIPGKARLRALRESMPLPFRRSGTATAGPTKPRKAGIPS